MRWSTCSGDPPIGHPYLNLRCPSQNVMTEHHEHHSAAWRGSAPTDRRIVRKARGLRVYAMLVGVAVLSGRVTIRAKPRR